MRVLSMLLAIAPMLAGCHNDEADRQARNLELQREREKETRRMDRALGDAMGSSVSLAGAKLIISEVTPDSFDESKLVCLLNGIEFRASLFDAVELVTLDYETRKLNVQIHLALPVKTGIPAGCELPPGATGMR
jgi:hypothetical protein